MASLADVAAAAARELELEYARAEEREVELTEAEKWARDPVGWINAFVWIASVFSDDGIRKKVRPARMHLFPSQQHTIDAYIDLAHLAATGELVFRNIDAEKSRQIGETWLFAALFTWILHYHPGSIGGALHTNGAEIDDGGERNTIKSLFGKIRYIDRKLDRGRIPGLGRLRFYPVSAQGPARVENLSNTAVIYGEGQKDNPFRGFTLDYLLVDEAAFVRHGELVYAAIDDACPDGKALVSTVNGDDNIHARIADEQPEGWTYLRLHWSEHPVYARGLHVASALEIDQSGMPIRGSVAEPGDPDCPLCQGTLAGLEWTARDPRAHRYPGKLTSPWYDKAISGKTDEQVAREYDIDREGALGARVFSEFQTDRHVIAAGIPFDESLPVELAWDFGLDTTAVVVLQDAPRELRAIGLLEMGDEHGSTATPERVAAALRDYLAYLGVERRLLTPGWTRRIQGIGDPAGDGRSTQTGISDIQAYSKQGFSIDTPPRYLTAKVETTIASVKRLLLGTPKPLLICGVNAGELGRHFRNNTWPVDPVSGKRRKGATKPEDDVHNHALRALAYYAVRKYPPPVEHDPDEPPPLSRSARARRDRGVHTRVGYGAKL